MTLDKRIRTNKDLKRLYIVDFVLTFIFIIEIFLIVGIIVYCSFETNLGMTIFGLATLIAAITRFAISITWKKENKIIEKIVKEFMNE